MKRRRWSSGVLALASALFFVLPVAHAERTQVAPSSVTISSTRWAGDALSYWSRSRLVAARPPAPTAAIRERASLSLAASEDDALPFKRHPWRGLLDRPPASTMGKIFYTDLRDGLDYTCSGTAVSSPSRSLVWTAGHCVHGGPGGGFHVNWVFIPGYRDGQAPHGVWAATTMGALREYSEGGDLRYDFGAAVVSRRDGRKLVEAVGGQGLSFNDATEGRRRMFGYAHAPEPLAGERLQVCIGPANRLGSATQKPASFVMGCDLARGISGGPWMRNLQDGIGLVTTVSSFKYASRPTAVFAPFQGPEALELFRSIGG